MPLYSSFPKGRGNNTLLKVFKSEGLTANRNNCPLLCHLLVILSHFCKECGPRSDCSSRSSLIRVHTVCLYAKIGLQEFSTDDINRRHFQMQVFFAF